MKQFILVTDIPDIMYLTTKDLKKIDKFEHIPVFMILLAYKDDIKTSEIKK